MVLGSNWSGKESVIRVVGAENLSGKVDYFDWLIGKWVIL